VGPEKAIQSIFKWPVSPSSLQDVVSTFRTHLKTLSLDLASKVNAIVSTNSDEGSVKTKVGPDPYVVKDGIVEFLSALRKVGTPCAIISHLERRQMDLLLQVSGLDHFFQSDMRVSESDAYESESQQLLGAALRIERRPDHCALFTSTPQSCVAAHEMQMKSVALVGPYPRYDLTTSDSTLLHLDTMNTMNLRALFSDEKSSEPMEQLQVEGPQVKKKSMVKTRFWEDGDR
jgi:phosphoglycolate phosphatase-like HAD superfamily hydrolase